MKNGVRNPMRLSKRGTTLVELIVALSLTAIFAVVCIALINPIERVYKQTERVARAQLLADTIVDGIRKECDNAKNDDINSVWIADGNINNDSGLFDEDCTLRKTEGHILVFKKNNSYCEAIFSELKITEQNKTDANNNSLEGTLSGHAVDDLFQGDKENTEKGIVHFGYYQAGDKGKGVYPLKSYDYTNPVLASTYGDFYVKIYFKNLVTRDVTINSVTHTIPSFVECEVRVYEGDYIESDAEAAKNLIYTRTAALCFSANGSAPGSSYQIPDKEKTSKEVTVFVIWDDNNNFRNQRPEKVNIVLNYGSKSISHELATNKNPNSIKFVNIDASSYSVALKTIDGKDSIDGYELPNIVWNSEKTEVVITLKLRQNAVKLISGPAFNKLLSSSITGVVFCSNAEALENGWIESSDSYEKVSIPSDATNDNNKTEDYKLYTKDKMVYVTSSDGTFVANENSAQMFMGCSNLKTVTDLNRIDTSNVYSMYRMFMDCRKLTQVDVGSWNTEKVVAFDGMFRNVCCDSSLSSDVKMIIDLRNFSFVSCKNLSGGLNSNNSVTGINKMFYTDPALTSRIDTIRFPEDSSKKNMQYLERMQQVFSGCDNLVNLENFNNLNLSGVYDGSDYKGIAGLFEYCNNLKSVDLSNWNLSNSGCKDLSEMFCGKAGVKSTIGIEYLDMSRLQCPGCVILTAPDPDPNKDLSLFRSFKSLKTVKFDGSDLRKVESFEKLFDNKTTLTQADFSGCNTSSVTSVAFMFHNCSNLVSVDMPGVVGSSCTSMESVFDGCKKLSDMDISNWNTRNITNMANSFRLCHTNTGDGFVFDLSDFKFGEVTNMKGMFNGSCATKIIFPGNPNFNKVKDIGGMFQNCKELKTIENFSNVSFPLIVDASHLFGGCSSLTSVDFNMELSNAQYIDYMYSNCTSLGSVNLIMYYPKATSAKGLFYGCSGISNVALDIDLNVVTDIESMFTGCETLTNVDLDIYAPGVTSIESLFSGCKNLTTLDFDAEFGSVENVSYLFNDCAKLKTAALDLDFSNVKHADYLFNGCSSLTSVSQLNLNMPDVETLDNLFSGCSSLTSINLDWDLQNATTIKNLFNGCTALKTADLKLILPAVDNINGMFTGCESLINVDLDIYAPGVTSLESLFSGCKNLTTLDFDAEFGSVENVSYLFNDCAKLKTAALDLDFSNVKHADYLFNGCSSLTSIASFNLNMPDVETLDNLFSGCSSLTSINLDWNLQNATTIKNLFNGCSNLKTLNLKLNLPAATRIDGMFNGCTGMTDLTAELDVPKVTGMNKFFDSLSSLTTIDLSGSDFSGLSTSKEMFNSCSKLTHITMNGVNLSKCTATGSTFNNCNAITHITMKNADLSKSESAAFIAKDTVQYVDISGTDFSSVTTLKEVFKKNNPKLVEFIATGAKFGKCGSTYRLFYNQNALTTVDFSNVTLNKCTSTAEMFSNCSKLTTVNMEGFVTPQNQSCSQMFYNCYNVQTINLGGWDTSSVTNMSKMFCNCCYDPSNNVTQASIVLDISSFDFSKVTTFEEMFNCDKTQNDKIVRIILPAGDKAVDKASSVNAKRMFRQRRNLLDIDNIGDFTIQNSISDVSSLFAGSGLREIDISGIDLSKVPSGKASWMFNNCSNLEKIFVEAGTVYENLAIQDDPMFEFPPKQNYATPPLTGGNGTAWSDQHIKGEYARVDDPDNGKPGYFTEKTA